MPHDDSAKCKEDGVKNQQHVMAPTLNYYTNPWMWSKCSRKFITEFLEYGPVLLFSQSLIVDVASVTVLSPCVLIWCCLLGYFSVKKDWGVLRVILPLNVLLCVFSFLKAVVSLFLTSTGYGECLLDEPTSRPYSLSQQLPGRIYNVNKQCELIFGPGTQVCPYMVRESCCRGINLTCFHVTLSKTSEPPHST